MCIIYYILYNWEKKLRNFSYWTIYVIWTYKNANLICHCLHFKWQHKSVIRSTHLLIWKNLVATCFFDCCCLKRCYQNWGKLHFEPIRRGELFLLDWHVLQNSHFVSFSVWAERSGGLRSIEKVEGDLGGLQWPEFDTHARPSVTLKVTSCSFN